MSIEYSEYDIVLEEMDTLREIDMIGFDTTKNNFFEDEKQITTYSNFDTVTSNYIQKIDSSFFTLDSVAVDTQKLSSFFNNIKNFRNFDDFESSISLKNTTEVEKIRSMYLSQYVKSAAKIIDSIVAGTFSDTEIGEYLGEDNLLRLKKQLVKTTINPTVALSRALKVDESATINHVVNSEFLVTFCIPFLRDFEVIKRYLTDDINSIKEDFKSCAKSIDMYNKVINNMLPKLSDDTIKSLNYFMYNFTRFVSQCFAYVSFMAIRKINAYMYNVNAINNLYSELMDYYSGGEAILHESVMDGSFDDIDEAGLVNDMVYGNASTLVSIADSIYRNLRTDYANINSDRDSLSTLDIETSSPLDSTVYDEIINTFSVINKSLDALKENIKDPSMIFDDALVKAGLDTRLTDRYKIFICTIPKANVPDLDKSKDSDKKYDLFSMMNEFAHASNMCKKVANAINDSYNKFKLVRSHLNENVDPIPDKCMSIEISDYMDSFDVQFRDLVLSISTSLIQRFQIMKDLCETLMEPDVIHLNYAESMDEIELLSEGEIQKIDFLEEAYNDIIATNHTFNAIIFEEKVNDFNRMRKNQHLRDVLGPLYEADENQNNQSVEVNDQSGSNPQAQAQNDAAADKIQKSNDNGTTSGNPDTEASKFNFGDFLDKIKNFFDTIMKKFSDSISKVSESNKDFIANNKEALLARSYDNITLKMANYGNLKENIYTTDLTKFKNALNSLNSETITNGNADEIANQLLSFVPQVSSIANKSKGLTNYYKTGKASEKDIQMMEFKNAKLRDEVSKMITFCEGFYNGGYVQIVNQIKDIKDTLSSKLNAISTDTTKNPSAKTGCNAVANTTRIFTAALLNCYRDRANDSIRALKKLVPKHGKNAPGNNQNNQNDQNNTSDNSNGDTTQNNGNQNDQTETDALDQNF